VSTAYPKLSKVKKNQKKEHIATVTYNASSLYILKICLNFLLYCVQVVKRLVLQDKNSNCCCTSSTETLFLLQHKILSSKFITYINILMDVLLCMSENCHVTMAINERVLF